MLLYFKIYFNNIEVISYSNKGPISTRTEEVLKLKICVNNNIYIYIFNHVFPWRNTVQVLQHSGAVTRKRLRTSEFLREVGNLFAPSVSRTVASSDSD